MGTNFYMMTKSKDICNKYFSWSYELTDTPDWGYSIHIAKTSMGWLPLFQSHDCFNSIKELKNLYDTGEFIIYDEYGNTYTWSEFDKRVLQFNGGTVNNRILKSVHQDKSSPFYDPKMPNHVPISHFEDKIDYYAEDYFSDLDGYEFTTHEFS